MGTRIALLVSVVLASLSIAVDCTAKPKKRPNERKVAWNIRLLIARYRSMVSPFLQRGRPERRADADPVGGANRHYDLNNFAHREPLDELNPLHEWVHECKRRRIDLKGLVTDVRLSPWATQEELEEINTWVKVKGFPCLVIRSELTSEMTPTSEELRGLGR
jgi:hypothetical protein